MIKPFHKHSALKAGCTFQYVYSCYSLFVSCFSLVLGYPLKLFHLYKSLICSDRAQWLAEVDLGIYCKRDMRELKLIEGVMQVYTFVIMGVHCFM